MNGTIARKIRREVSNSGVFEGTKYGVIKTGQIVCSGFRSEYQKAKKFYLKNKGRKP